MGEVNRGFCLGDLWERDYFQDPGIDRKITLKWIFKKWEG
jgi:hypothetical protein